MTALAFEKANSYFGKAIVWKTGGEFCHVELWLSGPRENALCFSSREPHGTDFMNRNLNDFTIVSIPTTPEQEKALFYFCTGTAHKSYDWAGILGFVLPWGEHDDKDRFCSEICTEALQKVLNLFTSVKPWMVSPDNRVAAKSLYKLALSLH